MDVFYPQHNQFGFVVKGKIKIVKSNHKQIILIQMFSDRQDGRSMTQIRGKELRTTQLSQFDGSAWYAHGQTCVLAAVCGPVAARGEQEDYRRCAIEVALVRSTQQPNAGGAQRHIVDRQRQNQQTSDAEFSMMLTNVLQETVLVDLFPRCVIQVSVDVLSDDGSLWSVAINAVMCALLDAAIPCRTTFCAVHVLAQLSTDPNLKRSLITMKLDPTMQEEQASSEHTIVSALLVYALSGSVGGSGGTLASKWTTVAVGNGALARGIELSDLQVVESLGEKASDLLFKFFRNCGVPPKTEEDEIQM